MARVMVTCPKTGERAFTGIETDAATFARLPNAVARIQCPLCGHEHTWSKADAMLVDVPSGSEPKSEHAEANGRDDAGTREQ